MFIVIVTAILVYQVSKLDLSRAFLDELFGILNIPFLLLGIVLVIPNYFLEILKWKLLGSQLEEKNFEQSTRDVLTGLKLGVITPLMIGDYLGRSLSFKKENKTSAVLLNLFNSLTQTWTALFFGSISLGLWYSISEPKLQKILLFPFVILAVFSLLSLAVLYGLQPHFLRKWTNTYLHVDASLKNKIIGLSLLRSIIYNIQYIFFYKAFAIILPNIIYLIGVNLILLIKTVGGGLNVLGDLSLRELVSINFFELYQVDQRLVLVATFAVWFFNIFSPIVFGIFYKTTE